jgi:LytS/YehU family sensor histidine kinase
MIAPFILIPVIENMFKHASGTSNPVIIKGELDYRDNQLTFYGINSKDNRKNDRSAGGIGLANMKRRLELIYPGHHSLIIKDSETRYEVWLTVQPI